MWCCFGALPKPPPFPPLLWGQHTHLSAIRTCLSALRIRCQWLTAGLPLEHCPWLTMRCPAWKATPYLSTLGTMTSSHSMMSDQGCIMQKLPLCHAFPLPGISPPSPGHLLCWFFLPRINCTHLLVSASASQEPNPRLWYLYQFFTHRLPFQFIWMTNSYLR